VLAYEKDPLTGIVRHLDDQCIGCSYCILKCPYDVPKFNERLGIVRKCDMCHGRLEASEAPACVQACPTQAIRIVKVRLEQSDGRAGCDTKAFLPVAPSAATTRPTTRYLSERGLPSDAVAADHGHHRRQPAHLPLVFLLVLSQLALGLQLAGELGLALILGMAGLAASTLHLGQPLRAWRVFLGLRRSWLSREAVALGLWVPALAGAWAGARWYPESPYTGILVSVAAVLGTIGVLSSAWLYADTPRRAWAARWTFPRFAGTTALGVAALGPTLAVPLLLIVKVGLELLWAQRASPATRALISGELRTVLVFRILTAVAATGLLLASESQPIQALGLVLILLGELLERTLFFVAVDPSAMPGQPAGRA
jgi:DMSO reductase anchor subunit/ferredoxin